MDEKVKGPASYFPSIERKYGRPSDFWMKERESVAGKADMEQVAFLKEAHQMGHGHANAIVAVFRTRS